MTAPDDDRRDTSWSAADPIPVSPAMPLARAFSVRVEFAHYVAGDDVLVDISGNPGHRLFDFLPQVTTNAAGRAEIELTVPGADVWTSVLTAMTVIRQSGYDPAAVHVTTTDSEGGLAA